MNVRLLLSLSALGAPLLVATSGWAKDYYVALAPAGNDANAGTEDAPFASMAKAQSVAVAGDVFYFKGGTYAYTEGTTTCSSGTATISEVVLNKSGSAGNLIRYWAAPGEKPVFDFDGIRDSCRIKGILVSGNYIHLKGLEIKGVRQNNNLNHESWGVWNQGSNNIFEALDVHHIMGAGIFIQRGSNNLVLNCDSHDNSDELTSNGAGESADGFGCHVGARETGNVFRGCRAWWNADDGYDFINSGAACLVERSWAWYNGCKPGTQTGIGNGNGFKGGGYGADPAKFPAEPAAHTVQTASPPSTGRQGFTRTTTRARSTSTTTRRTAIAPTSTCSGWIRRGTTSPSGFTGTIWRSAGRCSRTARTPTTRTTPGRRVVSRSRTRTFRTRPRWGWKLRDRPTEACPPAGYPDTSTFSKRMPWKVSRRQEFNDFFMGHFLNLIERNVEGQGPAGRRPLLDPRPPVHRRRGRRHPHGEGQVPVHDGRQPRSFLRQPLLGVPVHEFRGSKAFIIYFSFDNEDGGVGINPSPGSASPFQDPMDPHRQAGSTEPRPQSAYGDGGPRCSGARRAYRVLRAVCAHGGVLGSLWLAACARMEAPAIRN